MPTKRATVVNKKKKTVTRVTKTKAGGKTKVKVGRASYKANGRKVAPKKRK